ncbi:hypothetical protein [Polymorphobacter megasporae]|uniref:hypothetical protein n=1 Tax=Glacieibacterium megasporae TaxID=2835787 RepID=UPI001C1E2B8F|nr:hypothetical protein [Polymorphobacter megasporae]UAJ09595.1 hypothetical protein KTC28_14955 [Polymorphobacter megasporae]
MSFFSSAYKPKSTSGDEHSNEIGWAITQFEVFAMNPKLKYELSGGKHHPYPQITPITPHEYTPIDMMTQQLIDSMWKRAEPAAGAVRGGVQIGRREKPAAPDSLAIGRREQPAVRDTTAYNPHVNVTNPHSKSGFPEDWAYMKQIPRTNAITFRGDSRGPAQVLTASGGFSPPSSRTDRYYLENVISGFFIDYMQRRYKRTVTKADFLASIDQTITSGNAKKLLVDYLMWRKITQGEQFHLGNMLSQECLKGYISTSRNPHLASYFGSRFNKVPAWVYVTLVHGGYVVPASGEKWGTMEQEIAQWGPIVAADIVGFRKTDPWGTPLSPIYMRRSFRKKEPKAFEAAFNMLSGERPTIATT